MNNLDIKKFKKTDLMKILIDQAEEIEFLKNKLDEKIILLENSGSIADAALKLNNIFENAQSAADQYVESVKYLNAKKIKR